MNSLKGIKLKASRKFLVLISLKLITQILSNNETSLFAFPSFAETNKLVIENREFETNTYSLKYTNPKLSPYSTGFGSGITFFKKDSDIIYLYATTDRGPNISGAEIELNFSEAVKKQKLIVFPKVDFTPSIAILRLDPSQLNENALSVESVIELKDSNGRPLSGMPQKHQTKIYPVDINLEPLQHNDNAHNDNGIDPEGIAVDSSGSIWIADENGPSIAKIDPQSGKIIKRLSPQNGLPEILLKMQNNRGFESISITPDNKLYTILQSPIVLNSSDKKKKSKDKELKKESFIRIVQYDLITEKIKMFGYPIIEKDSQKIKDIKIGDLTYVSENKFYAIENIKDNTDKKTTSLVSINFNNVINTTSKDPLEIQMVERTKIVDLADLGWDSAKTDGLTILPDGTLLIAEDNDFGVQDEIKIEFEDLSYEDGNFILPKKKLLKQLQSTKNEALNTRFMTIKWKELNGEN